MAERSIAPDCKSGALAATGVRIPPCAPAATLAQPAEQHFCKVKVPGSIPGGGSEVVADVAQLVEQLHGKE